MILLFRKISPLKAILVGLIVSQLLSTLWVYISNKELYLITSSIVQTNYLSVPNQHVMPLLLKIGPAFLGGLFFTFTAGATLCVISMIAAWIWSNILKKDKLSLSLLLIIWLMFIWVINYNGFSSLALSYILCIPPLVFILTLLWLPETTEGNIRPRIIKYLFVFVIALIACIRLYNPDIFLSIRDNILLSNPLGKIINKFYYINGLYSANIIKSLNQRVIKTCDLSMIKDNPFTPLIEKKLLANDYLILDNDLSMDLKIIFTADTLVLMNKNKIILTTTPEAFIKNTTKILDDFSQRTDNHSGFRSFIFFSILFLGYLSVYFCFYIPLYLICSFYKPSTLSSIISGIIYLVIVVSLLFFTYNNESNSYSEAELEKSLESGNWRGRVDALKIIARKDIEICKFNARVNILKSPHVAERYWLAKAMSISRSPLIYDELIMLLDDSEFNVRYMAIYALGRRGDRKAMDKVLYILKTSDNWYIQLYAYRALRRMGWHQTRLKHQS